MLDIIIFKNSLMWLVTPSFQCVGADDTQEDATNLSQQ